MTWAAFVFKNLRRSKRRTLLTVLSVAIAIFLFVALKTVLTTFDDSVAASDDNRLVTRRSTSLTFTLPLGYLQKLRSVPGVEDVTWMNWFGGVYVDESNFFARFGVDMPSYLRLYPEIQVPADQVQDLMADKSGCLVGRVTAEKFHLEPGDVMTLTGDIYPGEWRFTVRAIYTASKPNFDETMMMFHWARLDEQRGSPGDVGIFISRLADPSLAAPVAKAIDNTFANSPAETRSETEKAFNMAFMSMMGNITALLSAISAAIILSIVMVAANTMAMAIRERTGEIGLLKVLGFPVRRIFLLVLTESLILSILGGICGVGAARLTLHGFTAGGALPFFFIRADTIVQALVIAVGIGLAAGFFPALKASRISPQEALRTIG